MADRTGKIKRYTTNDYFGEASMMLGVQRSADVIAKTDVELLVMSKYDFMYFIRGSEIAKHMEVIAANREYNTAELFEESFAFKGFTVAQQTQLQSILTRCEVRKGDVIAEHGNICKNFYLVDSGKLNLVIATGQPFTSIGRGGFIAKISAEPQQRGNYRFTIVADEDSVFYSVDVQDFYYFLEKNPGVFLLMRNAHMRDLLLVNNEKSEHE